MPPIYECDQCGASEYNYYLFKCLDSCNEAVYINNKVRKAERAVDQAWENYEE